jgi:hypothetical protein
MSKEGHRQNSFFCKLAGSRVAEMTFPALGDYGAGERYQLGLRRPTKVSGRMEYLQILAATAERASSESEAEVEEPDGPGEADAGTSFTGRKRRRRVLDGEPVQLPVSRPKDKDERIKARNRRAQQRWRDKQKARAWPTVCPRPRHIVSSGCRSQAACAARPAELDLGGLHKR